MASTPRSINIDVVSDTVCPWCYIGKKRMEKAMRQFEGKAEFNVHWRPFQLNPTAPEQGEDKREMYEKKFGRERVMAMQPMMEATFAGEGLPPISFGGKTGNTLNSHRLIWKAGQLGPGVQDRLVEELFANYFCQEKFLNDREVLLAAAAKAGVPDAAQFLDSDEGTEEVKRELAEFGRKHRVSGVPFFIIDDKYTVSGAQSPDNFADVFSRIVAGAA